MNHLVPTQWLLWDASAILPYYVPELARNQRALERATMILNAVRYHHLAAHCYIPNIVVAEVFTSLDRACYSSWDKRTGKQFGGDKKTLDKRRYRSARKKFRKHIHNGVLFYQHELSRYHILGLDLISPIDKERKHYRTRNEKSMGAVDLLVGAMAIHLVRIHGRKQVCLITTDRRMKPIFAHVPSSLKPNTIQTLGLDKAATTMGFGAWHQDLYPQVLDLARCKNRDLVEVFGKWPLPNKKQRGIAARA